MVQGRISGGEGDPTAAAGGIHGTGCFQAAGDDGAFLYKQRDGRLGPPAEILAHWRQSGIIPAKEGGRFEREVVFYCGGGWRSSVAFFHAWLLGFENIRNYSDGWSGWSTEYQADPAATGRTPGWRQQPSGNPVEAGAP
jgi:thiosulfate/3-mercaptopyruvate sulfurtransferase